MNDDDGLVTQDDVDRRFQECREAQAGGSPQDEEAAHERFAEAERLLQYGEKAREAGE